MADEFDRILTALTRLETGQASFDSALKRLEAGQQSLRTDLTSVRTDLTSVRTDLMARMDRLQHRLDSVDEHLTMGLGHSDRVEAQIRGSAETSRILSEQMLVMHKLMRLLESRVASLEDR